VTELDDQDLERAQGGDADKAARSPKPAQAGKGDSHKKEIDILSWWSE